MIVLLDSHMTIKVLSCAINLCTVEPSYFHIREPHQHINHAMIEWCSENKLGFSSEKTILYHLATADWPL